MLTRERAQATTQLTKPRVADSDFKAVVIGGGYQAAVLLDAQGRLLQIAPEKPALLGTQIGQRYPHLRSALKGKAAVSPVVPAAAGGAPIVGFATPFDTPQGRRVLSGAFDIRHSPLAAYLPSVTPIKPSAVDLIDANGKVRLAREAIPIAGRIVAVADVFDALTHERPYKAAWSVADALAEMTGQSGRHFDPAVLEAFLGLEHAPAA